MYCKSTLAKEHPRKQSKKSPNKKQGCCPKRISKPKPTAKRYRQLRSFNDDRPAKKHKSIRIKCKPKYKHYTLVPKKTHRLTYETNVARKKVENNRTGIKRGWHHYMRHTCHVNYKVATKHTLDQRLSLRSCKRQR